MKELLYCYWRYYSRQWKTAIARNSTNQQWARRYIGGRWECWYLDYPVCSMYWYQWDSRSGGGVLGYRRPPLGRGTPIVEDYTR